MKPWHLVIGSILFFILMTLTAFHRSRKPRFKDRTLPVRTNRVIRK